MAATPVQAVPEVYPPPYRSAARAPGLPMALAPFARWHLLSLDAPTVAVCWMLLFHHGTPVHTQAAPALALWLAVWCMYALDRLADARAGRELLQERHRFHWQHRRAFMVALGLAVLTLAAMLPAVPFSLRSAWLLLSIPLSGYAALVHVCRFPKLPKPLFTATFFAIATVLPAAFAAVESWHLLLSGVLFGGVCWLNCTFIEYWEGVPQTRTRGEAVLLSAAAGLMAMAVGCWTIERRSAASRVSIACGASVLALLLLHRRRARMSALALRSMADATLLTPLVIASVVVLLAFVTR